MPDTVPEAKPPRPSASSHSASGDTWRPCDRFMRSLASSGTRAAAGSRAGSAAGPAHFGMRERRIEPHRGRPAAPHQLLDATHRERGPAGLMARADAATVLAMEVLVEQHQVAPGRVLGVARVVTMRGTPAHLVRQE